MGIPAPKPWDKAYLEECAADEIDLARLLKYGKFAAPAGMTRDALLVPVATGRAFSSAASNPRTRLGSVGELPRWRRDWTAAGELSTQLGLSIYQDPEDGSVSVSFGNRRRNVTERYEDHPSKDAATWAALTRGAIQKLEASLI
jgi:hypothetical protein